LLWYPGILDISFGSSSSFDNLCSFRRQYVPVETFPVVSDLSDLLPQKSVVVVLSQYLSLSLPNVLTGMSPFCYTTCTKQKNIDTFGVWTHEFKIESFVLNCHLRNKRHVL
jgi:hypothetical protein